MHWETQDWVKLYTTTTVNQLRWPWQAVALVPLLLKVCGRRGDGTIDTGAKDQLGALSLLTRMPLEVVAAAVPALLADGTLEQRPTGFFLPNFAEAQRSRTADVVRKRDQRARETKQQQMRSVDQQTNKQPVDSWLSPFVNIENHDGARHEVSRSEVNRSEVSCFVPKQMSPVDRVFAHWKTIFQKNARTVFDAKRRHCVEAMLRLGFSAEDLCRAIDGCAQTPHNMGATNGKRYTGLDLILRDADQVERFIGNRSPTPREMRQMTWPWGNSPASMAWFDTTDTWRQNSPGDTYVISQAETRLRPVRIDDGVLVVSATDEFGQRWCAEFVQLPPGVRLEAHANC